MPKKKIISEKEIRQIPELHFDARVLPDSINEGERTIRVEYTTGARVLRHRVFDEPFYEELSIKPGDIRLSRLKNGAPLLNTHRSSDLEDVLGVVVDADERFATIKFSDRESVQPFYNDVKNGIIRNVSVGYTVFKFQDITSDGDDYRVLLAVDWEPFEISLVAVGADAGAGVRSGITNDCTIVGQLAETSETTKKGTEMPDEENKEIRAEDKNLTRDPEIKIDEKQVRSEAIKEERDRVSGIQDAVRKASLDQEFADKLISDGVSIDVARSQIIDEWADQDKHEVSSKVKVGEDHSRNARVLGIQNALEHRANPSVALVETGRDYRGLSLMELARDVCQANNINVRGMARHEVAIRALSTSDFAEIVANVSGKSLRDAYGNVTRTFLPWTRQTTLPDFKEMSRVALSESPSLEKIVEGGEYKRGKFSEYAEKIQLFTYGKIVRITRETIINDDLDAFTRVPGRMGSAAGRLESDLVYDILTSNGKMSDGKALFHADHGNLDDAVFSVDGLGDMRANMRKQKGPNKKDTLNIPPSFLIVPGAMETAAEKMLGVIQPNEVDKVNPFSNKMQLIVESRLDDNSTSEYFVSANPNDIDTIEYAYLDGESGPYIETREGFSSDGIEIKARHDFAAKPIDYRGLAKSTNDAT